MNVYGADECVWGSQAPLGAHGYLGDIGDTRDIQNHGWGVISSLSIGLPVISLIQRRGRYCRPALVPTGRQGRGGAERGYLTGHYPGRFCQSAGAAPLAVWAR